MPEYRRAFVPGGTFFLTIVTNARKPLFVEASNVIRLHAAIETVRQERPFSMLAHVVLPDHLHVVWTLPPGDADFSTRVGRMKVLFTKSLREQSGGHCPPYNGRRPASRVKHRESGVWQRRFWEHTIRDEQDFARHVDYIHYNPVKHGVAACPHIWRESSFMRWVDEGVYSHDWCCCCTGRRVTAVVEELTTTVGE